MKPKGNEKKYTACVCVGVLMLCPACNSARRDYQYNKKPKIAVSTEVSAKITDIISLSFSRCVVYDTKTINLRQDSDSIYSVVPNIYNK